MSDIDQGRLQQLDQSLAGAFEAAMAKIHSRTSEVIRTARLATAVHMSREAETTAACEQVENKLCEVSSHEVAAATDAGAALLVRGGRG